MATQLRVAPRNYPSVPPPWHAAPFPTPPPFPPNAAAAARDPALPGVFDDSAHPASPTAGVPMPHAPPPPQGQAAVTPAFAPRLVVSYQPLHFPFPFLSYFYRVARERYTCLMYFGFSHIPGWLCCGCQTWEALRRGPPKSLSKTQTANIKLCCSSARARKRRTHKTTARPFATLAKKPGAKRKRASQLARLSLFAQERWVSAALV